MGQEIPSEGLEGNGWKRREPGEEREPEEREPRERDIRRRKVLGIKVWSD